MYTDYSAEAYFLNKPDQMQAFVNDENVEAPSAASDMQAHTGFFAKANSLTPNPHPLQTKETPNG
jgi:hypothetical protein